MSRAERLLQLLQVLRRHRQPVTAAALAEELTVSPRSVYRDIDTLRAQGALIAGEAGVGFLLRPGFLLPPLMFSEAEIEAFVLGLRLCVRHADAALGHAASDVLVKLRAVLPAPLRELADETTLLAGPARERPPEIVALEDVRHAIRKQLKAHIDYADEGGLLSTRTSGR